MATAPTEYRLHSRYQPEREAARFLDHHPLSASCRDIIVLGPGEGYLFTELAKRYPHARLTGIQITGKHEGAPGNQRARALHLFTDPERLSAFLDREVQSENPTNVELVQWPPALRIEAQRAKAALKTLQVWLERLASSYCTTKTFAERWIINAIRSLRLPHAQLEIDRPLGPIVLASAGPSLDTTIDDILKKTPRKTWKLVAVSSAVPALLARDLIPDLVIHSDGGNWAQWHLQEPARKQLPILYQLGASIPSSLEGCPLQLVTTGQAWQQRLLAMRGLRARNTVQRGTVSALALDIALSLTDDAIYLAGLDLDSGAIRSHATPYAFDILAHEGESRTRPLWHWYESRKRLYKESRAMEIYAQWYRERAQSRHARCRVLSTSARPSFGMDGVARITPAKRAGGTISIKTEDASHPWPRRSAEIARELLNDQASHRELAEILGLEAFQPGIDDRLTAILERARGRR